MRVDLPLCSFKDCRYNFDGNCKDAKRKEKCKFSVFSEKQTPKKPVGFVRISALDGTRAGNCPICNATLLEEKFCPECGQAIDWTD